MKSNGTMENEPGTAHAMDQGFHSKGKYLRGPLKNLYQELKYPNNKIHLAEERLIIRGAFCYDFNSIISK